MNFVKYIIIIIYLILINCRPAYSSENLSDADLLVHSEFGSFNRVYRSKEFAGNNKTFLPVLMYNAGVEFHYRTINGGTFGAGYVQAKISGGRTYNYDYYEEQPETGISVPYFFIGNDFNVMAFEVGMSYYLTFMESKERYYFQPDGSKEKDKHGRNYFTNSESFVFVNFMIRFLPEKSYHIKIRFGRERFNIVDSLFNAALIYPKNNHTAEIYLSCPTGFSDYLPESNLRVGICYSYKFKPVTIGLSAGYLTSNPRGGGDGNMPIFDKNNFSYGIYAAISR